MKRNAVLACFLDVSNVSSSNSHSLANCEFECFRHLLA